MKGLLLNSAVQNKTYYIVTLCEFVAFMALIIGIFGNCGNNPDVMSVAILMIFWLAIRTFKWHFLADGDPLGRYIWYCYYIPMILIPLLGVFITMCIGKPENFKLDRRFNLLYIPAIILIVFILTNDFHNLTNIFPNLKNMKLYFVYL